MTKLSLYLAFLLVLLTPPLSLAEEGRGYVGGQVGMFLPIKSSVTGDFPTGSGTLTYDPGLVLMATGGYRFANGLRGEGELNFRRVTTDKLSTAIGSAGVDGDVTCYGFMTNLYYDIPTPTVLTLYLGAGAGVVATRFSQGTSKGAVVWTEGHDVDFAYQGIAGFAIRLNDSTSLDLVYHHYAVPRLHFQPLSVEFRGLNLAAGIRHWF
ncbi:outer membrane protein [Geomonas sp.]|uniref:outer membrane protein n=1 Tax=Geomonas sp. TaxID=2651584 RepID=UPI002B4725BE|nr:outer membrane beta-barrel protein [Geomonas sp.]HJV36751.1 outer membrane beta-barrel protein [Geomonas sp.]